MFNVADGGDLEESFLKFGNQNYTFLTIIHHCTIFHFKVICKQSCVVIS